MRFNKNWILFLSCISFSTHLRRQVRVDGEHPYAHNGREPETAYEMGKSAYGIHSFPLRSRSIFLNKKKIGRIYVLQAVTVLKSQLQHVYYCGFDYQFPRVDQHILYTIRSDVGENGNKNSLVSCLKYCHSVSSRGALKSSHMIFSFLLLFETFCRRVDIWRRRSP